MNKLYLNNEDNYEEYTCTDLEIHVYRQYLSVDSCKYLFNTIFHKGHWLRAHITEKGEWSKRRNKIIYGDSNLQSYSIIYQGETLKTHITSWDLLPEIRHVTSFVEHTTDQVYQTAIVQLYNNGYVGINPHKDKEVTKGTIISSLSLGVPRTMLFTRNGYPTVEILLRDGDLCLIMPPTNDKWLHSIPTDPRITGKRMSLVFRNSKNFLE